MVKNESYDPSPLQFTHVGLVWFPCKSKTRLRDLLSLKNWILVPTKARGQPNFTTQFIAFRLPFFFVFVFLFCFCLSFLPPSILIISLFFFLFSFFFFSYKILFFNVIIFYVLPCLLSSIGLYIYFLFFHFPTSKNTL